VVLKTTMPITSGSGDKKSTNYQPVFEISGWAPRPVDLVHVGKGSTAQAGTAQPRLVGPVNRIDAGRRSGCEAARDGRRRRLRLAQAGLGLITAPAPSPFVTAFA
jgi:hypothetical protein